MRASESQKAASKRWCLKNKEKLRAAATEWNNAHKEQYNEYHKLYEREKAKKLKEVRDVGILTDGQDVGILTDEQDVGILQESPEPADFSGEV